jgi:hypothetical protein
METRTSGKASSVRRWCRILAALLTLVLVLAPAGALARKKKAKDKPPLVSDLPNYLSYQAWKLRGVHIDDSGPITSEIQKLVLADLEQWFAKSPEPKTDVDVRRELERIFYNLRYPTSAVPACFDRPWKGAILVGAGYTLGWTNYNRMNVFALFVQSEGGTRLAAVTNFLPFVDLHYEFLPSSGDDFRFIIYGTRPGKSQPRLSAILYSFDGQNLKAQWQAQDVYDGKMKVEDNQVTIRYLNEAEYIHEQAHDRNPPRHEATYKITPQGLELESDRNIPF